MAPTLKLAIAHRLRSRTNVLVPVVFEKKNSFVFNPWGVKVQTFHFFFIEVPCKINFFIKWNIALKISGWGKSNPLIPNLKSFLPATNTS
jgi:hypothetical protein